MLALATSLPSPNPPAFAAGQAVSAAIADRGVFEFSLAGKTIGTEVFEIRSSAEKVEAQAEIHLRVERDGKTIDVKTYPHLVLDNKLQPLTYTWKQKGSQSSQLEVDFRSSPVQARYKTVNGQEDRRDFDLAKDVLVLDDNVVHHYQLVVDRYALTAGGKQTLTAFIPQEALPGSLSIEKIGTEAPPVQGSTLNLHHLVITTELAHVSLWVDEHRRLERIVIPEVQFEAVREH